MTSRGKNSIGGLATLTACVVLLSCGCDETRDTVTLRPQPAVQDLTVLPSSISLSSTDTYAVVNASGGLRPYRWTVSDLTMGTISTGNGPAATYSRVSGKSGANVVRVTDANNWYAEAIVLQE